LPTPTPATPATSTKPTTAPASPVARRKPTPREIDSLNTGPAEWARFQRADSIARAHRDTVRRPDTTSRFNW
jgi:hypothetical protein